MKQVLSIWLCVTGNSQFVCIRESTYHRAQSCCTQESHRNFLPFWTNSLIYSSCVLVLQIPLVGMADELEAQLLESLDKRATVSPAALPSAAFYTFVNSHHTLNCVTSSSDGACVAGQSLPSLLVVRSAHVVTACVATQHARSLLGWYVSMLTSLTCLCGRSTCSVIGRVAVPATSSLLVCQVTM